jgi:sigma-E factor negative regulatory protein RseC
MSSQDKIECVERDGIVQESGYNSVTVKISSASACSGCHAEGSCSLSGKEEKIVDVTGSYNVSPGDKVTVLMSQSAGYKALSLGYIFPLILVVAVLIILVSASVPELIAGLSAIAVLIPYYLALWFFKKRIGKKFIFTIKS